MVHSTNIFLSVVAVLTGVVGFLLGDGHARKIADESYYSSHDPEAVLPMPVFEPGIVQSAHEHARINALATARILDQRQPPRPCLPPYS